MNGPAYLLDGKPVFATDENTRTLQPTVDYWNEKFRRAEEGMWLARVDSTIPCPEIARAFVDYGLDI